MEENKCSKKVCTLSKGMWALLCMVVLGCFMIASVRTYKSFDREVSVRGLCEREVMADRAIYPIVYKETGNDLVALYATVNQKNKMVVDFLKENGFEDAEITVSTPSITDNYSNSYSSSAPTRYVMKAVVTVYTDKVQSVLELQTRQADLIGKGIAVGSGDTWENPIQFVYEGLNDIKPEMIEEANANARKAAEQFAKDSHSRLGKIKTATQGLFSIEERDSNTPQIKRIRVVTSVTYNLR